MISNKKLQKATEKINEALVRSFPAPNTTPHNFSPDFEQKIKKITAKPHNKSNGE